MTGYKGQVTGSQPGYKGQVTGSQPSQPPTQPPPISSPSSLNSPLLQSSHSSHYLLSSTPSFTNIPNLSPASPFPFPHAR
eukprot:619039-Hanusia_phi.AAC.1